MAQPDVTIYINTGTEGAPVWTEITSTKALYFADTQSSADYLDTINTPRSSSKNPAKLWISDISCLAFL